MYFLIFFPDILAKYITVYPCLIHFHKYTKQIGKSTQEKTMCVSLIAQIRKCPATLVPLRDAPPNISRKRAGLPFRGRGYVEVNGKY